MIPIYRHQPSPIDPVRVTWVPPAGDPRKAMVDFGGGYGADAATRFGLEVKEGDLVKVTTIGQTLLIDEIISRPTPPTDPAPADPAPDPESPTDTTTT